MALLVVVDDQGSNRRIYSKLASLVDEDASVKTFSSPFEMLDWAKTHTPDLVIADFKMPGMDGADLTRRLRALPDVAEVPIIVLTAYEDRSFRLNALEAGATDFMQTPVSHDEFISRARNLLRLRQQQQKIRQETRRLERRLWESETSRQKALRHGHEQLAQVIDTVPALISATNLDGQCVFVNAMFAVYAKRDPADCVGLLPSDLLSRSDLERNKAAEEAARTRGQVSPGFEERLLDPDGFPRSFLTTKSPLFNESGSLIGILTTSLDITEQKQAQERLRHLAQHDALTGLPNRTFLSNRLQEILASHDSSETGQLGALHLLDLDRFKSINDTLGHSFGDQLLQAVSGLLRPLCGVGVTLVRLGGDEFALLQEDITERWEAEQLASRIISALAKPIKVGQRYVNTTASLGIAFVGRDGSDVNEILKNADLSMYQAKSKGRNRYHVFSEDLRARMDEFAWLEAGIREALKRNEFVLHYQPQLNLQSGQIIGVEALIRWQHPERGLLMPGAFLPVAEESGLMPDISDWVLRAACRQLAEWRRRGIGELRLAVNISPSQFNRSKTWESLRSIRDEIGDDLAKLEIELTESAFVDQIEDAAGNLRLLKEAGVSIALDDFGTGFSSLGLAKELPIDALKIDRSFVCNLPHSKADAAITRAIIRLGHGLDLRVVAEGVENEEQLAFLRQEECDEIQGYYFSKPLAAEECLQRILQQNSGGTSV